jgi:hypothetical protein
VRELPASHVVLFVLLLVATPACVSEPEPEPAADDDDDDDDDSIDLSGDSTVTGTVVDAAGAPIPDLTIALCRQVCLLDATDADGVFFFEDVLEGVMVLESFGAPGDEPALDLRDWTRFFEFIDVPEATDFVLDRPYVVHQVDSVGPLQGSQDLDLGGGLQVRFDFDDLGVLPAPATAVYLGATSIPEADWPVGGLGDWTVVGAWGLATWDLHAEDGFAVQAAPPLAQPQDPSSEVAFLVADYTYGFTTGAFFEEPAVLSSDGLTWTTPADAGLDRTTLWLAVTRGVR